MTRYKPKQFTGPTPEKYALSGSEDAHQIALFMWAAHPDVREQYPELVWLFAIPNGGHRTKSQGARLKAAGLKPGVSDIFLPVPRGGYYGLFIEMKKPPKGNKRAGKATDDQNKWIDYFRSAGYGAMICAGWEVARNNIVAYLDQPENGVWK